MPLDKKGSAFLQILSASANLVNQAFKDAEWKLSLKNEESETITEEAKFNTFIKNLPATEKPNELVLFIRATVTEDDFLVVQKKPCPERNLLRSVFEMEGVERHVFVFTDTIEKSELTENDNEPLFTPLDPRLMKGVTLYRISCNANDIPIDKIKAAASKKPRCAVEFYRELVGENSEMRIGMVPGGKRGNSIEKTPTGTETSKKDCALLLVPDRDYENNQSLVETDLKYLRKICDNMENTEYIDIIEDLKKKDRKDHRNVTKGTITKYIRDCAKGYEQKIKEKSEDIGKIWLFVSAHGRAPNSKEVENPGITFMESDYNTNSISIQDLISPFLKGKLKDKTKILVIDACRGDFPPKQPDSKCVSKLGLLFRNEKSVSKDPWDVSGMKNCVTLFGSVPGFKAWENKVDEKVNEEASKHKGSIMFEAMQKAVQELRELQKPEELHAFVQRVQCCIDENESNESEELSSGAESLKPSPEHQIQIPEREISQEDSHRFTVPQNLESSTRIPTSLPVVFRMDTPNGSASEQPNNDETESTSSGDTQNEKIPQTHLAIRSSKYSREYVVPKPN